MFFTMNVNCADYMSKDLMDLAFYTTTEPNDYLFKKRLIFFGEMMKN